MYSQRKTHLRRSDCGDILLGQLLKNRRLACVVEAEHQDACLHIADSSCWLFLRPGRFRSTETHSSTRLALALLQLPEKGQKALRIPDEEHLSDLGTILASSRALAPCLPESPTVVWELSPLPFAPRRARQLAQKTRSANPPKGNEDKPPAQTEAGFPRRDPSQTWRRRAAAASDGRCCVLSPWGLPALVIYTTPAGGRLRPQALWRTSSPSRHPAAQ